MLITVVRNRRTGRYHPFLWVESPLPSDDHTPRTVVRYKCKMHHTTGFETFEDAKFSATEDLPGQVVLAYGRSARLEVDVASEDEWGPDETPARVIFGGRP
jgi:hypothetical protein